MKEWFRQFLQTEAFSSYLLLLSAVIAIALTNSPFEIWHARFVDTTLFWINEGLMSIFFLLVGLELKREFLSGALRHHSQILLPAVCAIGGMLVPALLYAYINYHQPTLNGWATPVATDIAFALGVLMLFGKRVPNELKLFLLALAIFDDIGAILIIGFWYTTTVIWLWLLVACIIFLMMYCCNRFLIRALSIYIILGISLWFALLKAGVHPTIAGILLAINIPNGDAENNASLLNSLEARLHPWVAYLIMPLFALANAGVSFRDVTLEHLTEKIVLGIALGLFVGKQIGVFSFAVLVIKTGYAKLPKDTSWFALYGVAILCGIGFTMSLFLGTLSFQNDNLYLAEVRLGVIIGSVLSGLSGGLALLIAFNRQKNS